MSVTQKLFYSCEEHSGKIIHSFTSFEWLMKHIYEAPTTWKGLCFPDILSSAILDTMLLILRSTIWTYMADVSPSHQGSQRLWVPNIICTQEALSLSPRPFYFPWLTVPRNDLSICFYSQHLNKVSDTKNPLVIPYACDSLCKGSLSSRTKGVAFSVVLRVP